MKPAGRERDIEIAKLKGYKHIHAAAYMAVDINGPMKWLPFWSTNRNDAWELWDELPQEKHYAEVKKKDCVLMHCVDNKGYIRIEGKDFADCVSQAWIAWKKGSECE